MASDTSGIIFFWHSRALVQWLSGGMNEQGPYVRLSWDLGWTISTPSVPFAQTTVSHGLYYCTALAVPANTHFLWRDVQSVHPLVGCQRSKNGTFDDSSLHRKNRNIATTSKYFIRLLIIGWRKTKVELDRVSNIWAFRLLGKLALSSGLSRVSGKNVFRALQVCNWYSGALFIR